MYDRAPRSLTKPIDSIGQNVGPGSYEAAEHGRTKHGMVWKQQNKLCMFSPAVT